MRAPATASVHVMPTNINHIAADLIAEQRTAAVGHGLTLDDMLDPQLPLALADPNWIAQIMTNLMLNAIHYTPAGGLVTLSSAVLQDRGQDWITFSVHDTGPGISPVDMQHLFKRFYRGEAGRAAGLPGTGLGLAICKEIIDKLGGRITVDSPPGAGATFTVWIQPARD